VHIDMYTHVHIYTYTCIHACTHVYIHAYTCIYTHIQTYTDIQTCTHTNICMYMCGVFCAVVVYECTDRHGGYFVLLLFTSVHTYSHINVYARTHIRTYTYACLLTCAHMYRHGVAYCVLWLLTLSSVATAGHTRIHA